MYCIGDLNKKKKKKTAVCTKRITLVDDVLMMMMMTMSLRRSISDLLKAGISAGKNLNVFYRS